MILKFLTGGGDGKTQICLGRKALICFLAGSKDGLTSWLVWFPTVQPSLGKRGAGKGGSGSSPDSRQRVASGAGLPPSLGRWTGELSRDWQRAAEVIVLPWYASHLTHWYLLMEIQSAGRLPVRPLAVAVEEEQVHARGSGLLRGPCFSSRGGIAWDCTGGMLLTGLHASLCARNQKKNSLGESGVALLQIGNSVVNNNYGHTYI